MSFQLLEASPPDLLAGALPTPALTLVAQPTDPHLPSSTNSGIRHSL